MLPLEAAILSTAIDFIASGTTQFHGFVLAKHLRDAEGAKLLTAHGTLYKALSRMEKAGWLVSQWEDPDVAESEGRPRRRLYEMTAAGHAALARATQPSSPAAQGDVGWSPA